MTDRIDQLEFRWQPGYDFSAIAASSDPRSKELWDQRLRDYVGMPNEQPGAFLPTSSAVYYTTGDGKAALVVRVERADARVVAQEADPGRHKLVARALVGDARALTPELALCLACSEVSDLLEVPLGEVAVAESMPPLSAARLRAQVEDTRDKLSDRCRQERGLPWLIAARLEQPASPLNVLLDPEKVSRSLYATPAIPLLWGLFQTTRRLLEGTGSVDHRSTTFTTFEPPFRDAEGRQMPHVVFQWEAGRKPPSFTQVSLLDAPAEPGPWSVFATGLATAYAKLGTGLDRYLDEVAAQSDDLGRRAELLVSRRELSGYWDQPRRRYEPDPLARGAASRQARSLPTPATPADRFAPVSASASLPAPRQSRPEAPPLTSTGPHAVPHPPQPIGIELQKLYKELNVSAQLDWFGEVFLLVVAKVQTGHTLPNEQCHHVLGDFRTNKWYLNQLHQRYDRHDVVRMLGLAVQPVLSGLLRHHPSMFKDLSLWGDLPSGAREAMCLARARIPDEKGGLLLEEFLFGLLRKSPPAPPEHPPQPKPSGPTPAREPDTAPAYGISSKNMAAIATGISIFLTVLLLITLLTR